MSKFIPEFHFDNPKTKLSPEWCKKAVQYLYFQTDRRPLLHKKNVDEIRKYACGEFSMEPFERLYKSVKKSFEKNNPMLAAREDSDVDDKMLFEPLPLIPTKINAAVSVIQKIPTEVSVTALDALAAQKKNEDIKFLKNKPAIEEQLQPLADQLMQKKIDLGATKHSAIPYNSNPYGLDLNDDEQVEVFANIIYNLGVEVSFETILQIFYEIQKGNMIKGLEVSDQFLFGVSCNSVTISQATGMPTIEYENPENTETPPSDLPDFSDNTYRVREESIPAMDLMRRFPKDIPNKDKLYQIINEKTTGYCECNNIGNVKSANFDTFRVTLIRMQVRSVDSVGVVTKKNSGRMYLTDPDNPNANSKIWGQNTYVFYWLKNTENFFDIHKLDYAYRTIGNETIQNFMDNIYRSQRTSAVELSVKENKRAQVADIKMQYGILMSLPAGKYIDLKYLRGAIDGLKEEDGDENSGGSSGQYTMDYLIELALQRNIIIGDTEGFDGKHDGQFKPFMDIAGGLKTEINGYISVIQDCKRNISEFTGINEQLTGQSANPEGLIGLQKLLINSSLNSLYYANEGIAYQQQGIFNILAPCIQAVIEAKGEGRKAIVSMIGDKKTNIIDRLDEIPLHKLGCKVTTTQREEERAKFEERKNRLLQVGAISVADEYMLDAIQNPKDKIAILAAREKQFRKQQDQVRQEQAQQQQAMIQAQGQNAIAVKQADAEGKVKQVYAKGDVQANIAKLMNSLGMNEAQLEGTIKRLLQADREDAHLNKSLRILETQSNLKNQAPQTAPTNNQNQL